MNYQQSIEWLFSTQLFGIKLGLDGPRRLLREFLAFPAYGVKVIHVAGTNGKGSTCALIDSVARAGALKTGLFTSPHLIDFRERIMVAGRQVGEDDCARLLSELREICEEFDSHPTFFEITLAAGMKWFRECECELIILETGMGGRLDATTAVPADVCVITPVSLDHTQWLGDTEEQVAGEKAGIIVAGKPVICAPQSNAVRGVIEREANQRRAPLTFVEAALKGYSIGLHGEHQAWNAALALECLYVMGVSMDYETVRYGLTSVKWPGRFEIISLDGTTLVLDGAHNPQAAEALALAWKAHFGEQKCALVFAAMEGKDAEGIAAHLEGLAEQIHLCAPDAARAMDAQQLGKVFSKEVRRHDSVTQALEAASGEGLPVLVAGSLFLVGEAKAALEGKRRMQSEQ